MTTKYVNRYHCDKCRETIESPNEPERWIRMDLRFDVACWDADDKKEITCTIKHYRLCEACLRLFDAWLRSDQPDDYSPSQCELNATGQYDIGFEAGMRKAKESVVPSDVVNLACREAHIAGYKAGREDAIDQVGHIVSHQLGKGAPILVDVIRREMLNPAVAAT